MNYKKIDKIVRSAKAEKSVLVLNFSGKELDYAHVSWVVVNVE